MEDISLTFAKAHLEDLMARAARGETVRIVDPVHGAVRVVPDTPSRRPKRVIGQWTGKYAVPSRLLEPMSDAELRWLSGEESP